MKVNKVSSVISGNFGSNIYQIMVQSIPSVPIPLGHLSFFRGGKLQKPLGGAGRFILRDGSLFMGMTGLGKNRTGFENFSCHDDGLCVFFLNKETGL